MREMRNLSEQHSQQPKQFRGGEKKVMKKRLAMLLSVAMAFSMFANVAFGAEAQLTTKEKFEALVKDGIFAGVKDKNGNVDPQLNTLTDRAQFAKILALTAGLSKEEGNSFKDKGYSTSWAKGYIEAVTKAGYMTGVGNEKFDLKGKVTGEQMAKSFALALGLKKVEDAPAVEGVSKWAYGYVAAIKAAGFDFSVDGKWNVPVQRAVLVEAAYEVKQKTSVKVESVKALDEKTIEVKFTDGETVKHTLDKALVEGQETTVEVTHKGAKHQVKVTLEALKVEAKVAGLKKVEAKLNRTVDPAKVKVEIKRGSSVLTNKEVKFDDTKTTAQVELGAKMAEGEYTLTVTGASYQPISTTFKVEEEKVAKIALLGDKAAISKDLESVSIGYKITNQYGDDISNTASVEWNVSKGNLEVDAKNSRLVLHSNGPKGNFGKFMLNEKISISALDTHKFAANLSQVVTVSEFAVLDKVDFKGIYHPEKKTLNTDANYSEFFLLFDAFDQYGNKLTQDQLKDSVYAYTTNQGVLAVQTVTGATYAQVHQKDGSLALGFVNKGEGELRFDGKVTINLHGLLSSKQFSHEVEVAKAATVTSFKLLNPDIVAAGETVKIPFEAQDQFGNKLTSFEALKNVKITGNNVEAKKDPITKDLVIEYKAKDSDKEEFASVTSNIPNTAQFSYVNFTVKKKAFPQVISGVASNGINVGENATADLNKDNIKIQDQYGREMTLDKALELGYKLQLKNNNPELVTVAADDTVLSKDNKAISVKGVKKGSASLELTLVKPDGQPDTRSTYAFNVNVVGKSAITSYVVEDVATIADLTGAGVTDVNYVEKYKTELKVSGVNASGQKVAIDSSLYTVSTDNEKVNFVNGKLVADGLTNYGDKNEVKVKLLINIDGAENAQLTKEVTVSKAKSAPASIKLAEKAAGTVVDVKAPVVTIKATDGKVQIADLFPVVLVKDQYGVEKLANAADLKADLSVGSEGVKFVNDGLTANQVSATDLKVGSEFTVTFIASNNVSTSIKVVIV
ncbi:S-layer homology domain-containing protein [Paenibacillus sp. SC116]|uniref:S-layer homology domain-containing protein n=1 Tax=Paenibacillus sp. SC116 TaxID=2968986 RepID=UPI00215AC4DB|nr:S-layer homology domain-containing protein [Paenibacillus sp. SC116]MCR8844784.1 S-layer homology domain-containing protein [Paenibacillus sp. SC116]